MRHEPTLSTQIAELIAGRGGLVAADALRWLHPEHAATIDSVLAGRGRLAELPAKVAIACSQLLTPEQLQRALDGETRTSVLGRPRRPKRPAEIPTGGSADLRAWVHRRSMLTYDQARQVIAQDPHLIPTVLRRCSDRTRAALLSDAAHGRIDIEPDQALDPFASNHYPLVWSVISVITGQEGDSIWTEDHPAEPWWWYVRLVCLLNPPWLRHRGIPPTHHQEVASRAAGLPPDSRQVALTWLVASGATYDSIAALVASHNPDGAHLANMSALASDEDCAQRLAIAAIRTGGLRGGWVSILTRFGHALPLDTLKILTERLVESNEGPPARGHPDPLPQRLWFLWATAAGFGHNRIPRDRFEQLCDWVAERWPEDYRQVISVDDPITQMVTVSRPYPLRYENPALIRLLRDRATTRGWRSLLSSGMRPVESEALAELVADAISSTPGCDPAIVFELLDTWPGTLEELAATAAVSQR